MKRLMQVVITSPNIVAGLAESAYGREIAVTRQFNNVRDFAIAGPPLKATRHPLFPQIHGKSTLR